MRRRAALAVLLVATAGAQPTAVQIEHAWARPTPPGAPTGAVYMSIRNTGSAPERLLGASSASAQRIEIHESIIENGIMTMRHRADGIEIAPGATLVLEPGGLHLMLIGLQQPLVPARPLTMTLQFAQAGNVQVTVQVTEQEP
jgi:hypothetical protein